MIVDVEKMFYNVIVPTKDSRYIHFLSWSGGNTDKVLQELQMLVRFVYFYLFIYF